MKIQNRLLLVLVLSLPMRVAAETGSEYPDYARPSGYAGGGFAVAFEQFEGTGGFDFGNAYGGSFWLGSRLTPNLAVEGQVEYLSGFDPLAADGLKVTLNLKVYVATGQVQPFFVVGGGLGWAEAFGYSDTGFVARFGGGLDLWVTDNFALVTTATYALPTGGVDGLDHISLVAGLQFRF